MMLVELKNSVLKLKRTDIKDEMQEAISFPPIKTEHEVRL